MSASAAQTSAQSIRAFAVAAFAMLLAVCLSPPRAEAQLFSAFSHIDEQGVDVTLHTPMVPVTEVAIGDPAAGGLAFSRTYTVYNWWTDDLSGGVTSSGSNVTVRVGNAIETFTLSSGVYVSNMRRGSTLTYNSGSNIWTYTLRSGVVVIIDGSLGITSLTKPDGEVITWTYTVYGGVTYPRRQSVSNNLGYQIHFKYAYDVPGAWYTDFWTRTRVTAIDRSVYSCADTAYSCDPDGGGQAWPYVDYGVDSSGYETATDRLGNVTRYETGMMFKIRTPSSSSTPVVSYEFMIGGAFAMSTPSGSWFYMPLSNGVEVTSAGGVYRRYVVDGPVWPEAMSVREIWEDSSGTRKTVFNRDSYGRVTSVIKPDGSHVDYSYDDRGNVTQTTIYPKTGSSATPITTSASYPSSCSNPKTCNQPTSTTDAAGQVTDYTYDSTHGGVLTITAPAPGSGPYSSIRPQTRFTYTSIGGVYRLTSTSSCRTSASCSGGTDEAVASVAYDSTHRRPTSATQRNGNSSIVATTAFTYTPQGDVATTDGPISGSGDTAYAYYDVMRRPLASVSPDLNGGGSYNVSRTIYSAERVVRTETGTVTSPGSWGSMTPDTKSIAEYNSDGLVKEQRAEAWDSGTSAYKVISRANFGYDADLRAQCTALRMNESFPSPPSSACSAGTAGSFGPDRITYQGYDTLNQPTGPLSAYGTSVQRTERTNHFNAASGLLEWVEDARGYRTSYEYDDFNRLKKTIFPSPSAINTSNSSDYEQLTYDTYGRLSQLRRRDGATIAYAYDNLSRVISTDPSGSDPTLTYAYDNFGNVVSTSDGTRTISDSYDALSRLISETMDSLTVAYEYDAVGRRTKMTWPDGFHVNYDYGVLAGVTAIRENSSSTIATFSYDIYGRRVGSGHGAGTSGRAFDAASRLNAFGFDVGGSANDNWTTLAYTPAGQIASRSPASSTYEYYQGSTFTDAYTSNGLNQITAVNSTSFSHDSRGNLTNDGTKTYAYDVWNRMTSAGSASLGYDPAGRLREVASGGATTRFLYDGADLIAEYNGSGTLLRRYVHGPETDEPLIWYESNSTANRSDLFADERGSILRVEGATNAINTYDAYGRRGSGNTGRFQYTGQTWLSEAGLYYYKARMYNPEIGRFMQTDPIGYGDGMNWYNYVGSDPVNGSDPTGTECYSIYSQKVWVRPDGTVDRVDNRVYAGQLCFGEEGGDTDLTVPVPGNLIGFPRFLLNQFRGAWPVPNHCAINQRTPASVPGGYPTAAGDYGMVRTDEYGNQVKHYGNDISATVGTDVVAAFAGVVTSVDNADPDGYGLRVKIRRSGTSDFETLNHLSSAAVTVGQRVWAGQIVGKSGISGNGFKSGTPHLHYEYRRGADAKDKAVDPQKVLPTCSGGGTSR